ncbi:MAG: amidohydrolase family protein [Verrucomicrobia bacterium]|nr:amidohydrolase family protein [Verrucomicrobiota bacterium]
MGWVDADAHVVESPHTWDYLTPSERKFRPGLYTQEGDDQRQHWVIDGKIRGLNRFVFTTEALAQCSAALGRDMTTTMATRDLEDVAARIRHMDELSIDVQILYPSIFLDQCTERPDTDVALCGAYNRWMADVWKEGKGRLRWMATLPLLSMPDALDQLKFAKENGACGIFMRALEGTRQITDLYFSPLYEEAQRIDFCIGLHQANGNWNAVTMLANPDGSRDFFNQYRIFNVGAFFRLVNGGLPKMFPKLRFGFIETAASWIPWVIYELRRRLDTVDSRLPDNLMEEYRLFVTCQVGDDVPYLLNHTGHTTMMIGTDYGHADSSTELEALTRLKETGGITPQIHKRIVEDNPRTFYGLGHC